MLSGMWPHFESVAKKCHKVKEEANQGKDLSKFITQGNEDKRIVEKRVV